MPVKVINDLFLKVTQRQRTANPTVNFTSIEVSSDDFPGAPYKYSWEIGVFAQLGSTVNISQPNISEEDKQLARDLVKRQIVRELYGEIEQRLSAAIFEDYQKGTVTHADIIKLQRDIKNAL